MSTQIPLFPLTVRNHYLTYIFLFLRFGMTPSNYLSSHRGDQERRGGGGDGGCAGSAEGLACQSQAEMLALDACSTSVV